MAGYKDICLQLSRSLTQIAPDCLKYENWSSHGDPSCQQDMNVDSI